MAILWKRYNSRRNILALDDVDQEKVLRTPLHVSVFVVSLFYGHLNRTELCSVLCVLSRHNNALYRRYEQHR
jgi:hypothetical protein